jgi:hypothetical protein
VRGDRKRPESGITCSPVAFPLSRSGAGGVAQLGEHLLCKQGVGGSNPLASTSRRGLERVERRQGRGARKPQGFATARGGVFPAVVLMWLTAHMRCV